MKINLEATAVKWEKDGDHPDVEVRVVKYEKGIGGYLSGVNLCHLYISHERFHEPPESLDNSELFKPMIATFNKPECEGGGVYYRKVWPFNLWKLYGEGKNRLIDMDNLEDRLFYEDWLAAEAEFMGKSRDDIKPHGWLKTPDKNGRIYVGIGWWVVTYADGSVEIIEPNEFDRRFPGAANV